MNFWIVCFRRRISVLSIWIVNSTSRVNRAYADACGHPQEFFIGKNHFTLYPGAEVQAIFQRVVNTGKAYTGDARPFEFPDHPEWGMTDWDWTLQPAIRFRRRG